VTCPVCAKREARYPQVCDVCRARLPAQLWELSDLDAGHDGAEGAGVADRGRRDVG
jgi:hypothetical protein